MSLLIAEAQRGTSLARRLTRVAEAITTAPAGRAGGVVVVGAKWRAASTKLSRARRRAGVEVVCVTPPP